MGIRVPCSPSASKTYFPVREFQALTDCPKCGLIAYHRFSEPPEEDYSVPSGWDVSVGEPLEEVVEWGGDVVSIVYGRTYYRTDKSTCDVVRECECGATWGEK